MADSYMCPGCGDEIQVGGAGCPKCTKPVRKKPKKVEAPGSWEQDSVYDGLNLPGDDFDYDSFVQEEFGDGSKPAKTPREKVWMITAIVLVAVIGIAILLGMW